jgi:hypothetical protein
MTSPAPHNPLACMGPVANNESRAGADRLLAQLAAGLAAPAADVLAMATEARGILQREAAATLRVQAKRVHFPTGESVTVLAKQRSALGVQLWPAAVILCR